MLSRPACLSMLLAVAAGTTACGSPQVALQTRFEAGRSYVYTVEHVDERNGAGEKSRSRTVLEMERRVEKGGVLRREPLIWRTRVRRIVADIDEPGERLVWDSATDDPTKARFHAVLAGATWKVTVDPTGVPEVVDVTPNRAALEGAPPDTQELVSAVTSEAALTAQTLTWLAWMPSRAAKVGDAWTVSVPGLGPVKGTLTWTVKAIRGDEAHLSGTLDFPREVLGQPLEVSASSVDAIFDLTGGQVVQLAGQFELAIGPPDAQRRAKQRFAIRTMGEATSAASP